MKRLSLIYILLVLCFNTAYTHELALTFDDLPDQQDHPIIQQRDINISILKALEKYKAPAIGFVDTFMLKDYQFE